MSILKKISGMVRGHRETPADKTDAGTDLLHPPYFSEPRCKYLRSSFEKTNCEIRNITIME